MNSDILLNHAHLLPPSAQELVRLIGLPATLRLVGAYKGRVLQIPKGKRERGRAFLHELAEKIGKAAADAICRHYGGGFLVVPKCKVALQAARDVELQGRFDALTGAGRSARQAVSDLVAEFSLVESSVWRALKRPAGGAVSAKAGDDSQAVLFV